MKHNGLVSLNPRFGYDSVARKFVKISDWESSQVKFNDFCLSILSPVLSRFVMRIHSLVFK